MVFSRHSKEEAKQLIKDLVEKFKKNEKTYLNFDYDESNVRAEFIDKFFSALNWDVYNDNAKPDNKKEVIREKSEKDNNSNTIVHPDYAFMRGTEIVFYVEAKKPSIDIKQEISPAHQLRLYGCNRHLQISVLTNFQVLSIYDVRKVPRKKDSASISRIKYITYDKYIEEFDDLWKILSWDSVYDTGDFDDCVSNYSIRGTQEIDNNLLSSIEKWRKELSKDISRNNTNKLSFKEFNLAVQKIIDRIVFLRIAEDKEIEQYGSLKDIIGKSNTYKNLIKIFEKANDKYNSGLFKPEKWLNNLIIEDKVLYNIISEMYPDGNCDYKWDVLPIEILGNIYEKFLGSEIKLKNVSNGKQTVIIDVKPEVKKAKGVYYTPKYVVDFIIKSTLGEKLKDLTIKEAYRLKILDPACGSGSFLIGAYKYLLDWYFDKYYENKDKHLKSGVLVNTTNGIQLSVEEKKKILLNNIYGVDIDYQAVEVTKLSLFLQMLDNQGKLIKDNSYSFLMASDGTILPDMSNNIKCGNSLISKNIYIDDDIEKLTQEECIKINPFDWDIEFKEIIDSGGFDVVIGNPPYYNIQSLGANNKQCLYLKKYYTDIYQDKSDILCYFIYKALKLSREKIGFIISNSVLTGDKSQLLRNCIVEDGRLKKIINFEEFKVFDAGITTCILLFNKTNTHVKVKSLKGKDYSNNEVIKFINNDNYYEIKIKKNEIFALIDDNEKRINEIIDNNTINLGELCFVGKGMETAANDVFCDDKITKLLNKKYIRNRVEGKDIEKYYLKKSNAKIMYYEEIKDFDDLPIILQNYLKENKNLLKDRATVKNEGRAWWKYSRPMHRELYDRRKIWCSYRAKENKFYLDESNDYIGLTNTTVVFETNSDYDFKYILAILNSKLIKFRYNSISKQTGGGSFEYVPHFVEMIPIKRQIKKSNKK